VHIRSTGLPNRYGDERLRSGLLARADGARRWTVVLVDRPVDAPLAAALRNARSAGVLTLTSGTTAADLPVELDAALHLAGETGNAGRLHRRGLADLAVHSVDRLPYAVAAEFARDLAGLATADGSDALPRAVRLAELATTGLRVRDDDTVTGSWSPARDRLQAVLGRTADATLTIDLCADGPHALVAGTTGSGKSELLQTLIVSLAMHHSPDRCSFLLVDYKGGSAFAEAATLPHTVGMVTDLDAQTTARALRSLTAELTRRESVLANHRVADVADLPPHVDLARLVIVVDEFATLAEELPSFVPGLVSIAQRGRSLGVHLVLATQRPAGVVSPEIRANCSLRVCLRTTDEADSRDVLGTPSAAHLPVDSPGRAYLRAGSAEPTLFQTARVASTARPAAAAGPEVRRWAWPAPSGRPPDAPTGESDLARLRRGIAARTEAARVRPPHRPWRPPLQDRIPPTALDGDEPDRPATRLHIGLVDLPDTQRQVPLELDLADAGTWLAVGGPRSGRSTLLRTVLREAVSRMDPDALHVHLIESGGGSLGREVAALPHAGTVVSGDDVLRTVRLVERLADEVAARRASLGGAAPTRILVLVDGVEQLTTLVEEAVPGHGSAMLTRLFRDGAAVGVTSLLTADRAVPGGRLAGLARTRLVLPLADRADYAVAGIPPRAVPEHRPPGRALLGEDAVECQLALPREPWRPLSTPVEPGRTPLCIPELSPDPVVSLTTSPELVIGPGGDEGRPLTLDLLRCRGLLVAGSSGTGRTGALEAFAQDLRGAGFRLLWLGHRTEADPDDAEWVAPSDEAAVRRWIHALDGRPGVVVADDVGTPAEFSGLNALTGPAPRLALLAAGQPAQLAAHFQGPVAALRRARTGLLLCPGPGDADVLGVRLPRMPLPVRPGSGWLVAGGRTERVQVARRRTPSPA
jgi:S-DNA-T family DNA segregation ATPase FtsK/SpoIIIE